MHIGVDGINLFPMKITKDTFRRHRLRTAVTVAATAALFVGGIFGGQAIGAQLESQAQIEHAKQVAEIQAQQERTSDADAARAAGAGEAAQSTADAEAAAAAQAAAEALAAQQAAQAAADAAAAQAAADAAAKQKASAPKAQQQTSSGPVQCPAGTKANAVDAAGNESNCEPLNGDGQTCQAYDANNNCTNWYKP